MQGKAENTSVWRDALAPSPDCLPLEALEALVDEKTQVVDAGGRAHLARCANCQTELAMLRVFELADSPSRHEADVRRVTQSEHQENAGASRNSRRFYAPLWHRFFRSPFPLVATLATCAVAAFVYISQTRTLPVHVVPAEHQILRSGSVRLIEPSGALDTVPATFVWEVFPGTAKYSVELLEVDGTPLWKEEAVQNSLTVTPALRDKISSNKALLWRVTAFDASGKMLASSSQERFVFHPGQKSHEK